MAGRNLALLVVVLLVASACAPEAPTAEPALTTAPVATAAPARLPSGPVDVTSTAYRPEPVGNTGGTLTIGAVGFPQGLYGYHFGGIPTAQIESIALWGLWGVTPDMKYAPRLATAVPTVANGGVVVRSDGGMDVRIELVPGALWSDGQPITCRDVADTVTWVMEPPQRDIGVPSVGWEDITAVDGGTGSSCVAHFARQSVGYLGLWSPLLPSHYVMNVQVGEAMLKVYSPAEVEHGVYSGPYMPMRWVDGQEIDYVPNPGFWATVGKRDAPFSSVILKYYRSTDAEIAGYADAEIDVAMSLDHSDLPKLASFPSAEVDQVDSDTSEMTLWNAADLVSNWGEDGAAAILEALPYAYDKQALVDRTLGGHVLPICNPVSPLAWFHVDVGRCPAHDAAKAAEILDAAGFAAGADGIRGRDGRKLEFGACTTAVRPFRVDTLTLLAAQLEEVGIRVNLPPIVTDSVLTSANPWASGDACANAKRMSSVVEIAYAGGLDPSIYFDEVPASVDLATVRDAVGRSQDLFADPASALEVIPLHFWKSVTLKSPRMHNVQGVPGGARDWGSVDWNIADWWRSP